MEDIQEQQNRLEINRDDDLLYYGEEFKNAKPLTYEQVFNIVHQHGQGEYAMKTLDYCKQVKKDNMNDLVDTLKNQNELSQLEIVSICNLLPKTIDQAKAFVPSIANKNESELKHYIQIIEQVNQDDDDDGFLDY